MMMNIRVYVSGSEKNAPDGFTSWRKEVYKVCTWFEHIHFVDPVDHFNYDAKHPVTSKQCYQYFMWLIDQCDVVLVNLDHTQSSVGTGYEVQHAVDCHKPIIGFGSQPETWYEWTYDRCDIILDTIDDAIEYINEHYVNM